MTVSCGLTPRWLCCPRVLGTEPEMQRVTWGVTACHNSAQPPGPRPGPGVGEPPADAVCELSPQCRGVVGTGGGEPLRTSLPAPTIRGPRPRAASLRDCPGPGTPHNPWMRPLHLGCPFGLTLTRQGFYYPASQVGRSDAGPQAPGKGLEGRTPVALSCCCIRSPCQPCQGGASTPARPGGKASPPRGLCSSRETRRFRGAF